MNKPLFQAHFHETYSVADVITTILTDRFSYLRSLEGFYCDERYLAFVVPFRKRSSFHRFIEFVTDDLIYENILEHDLVRRQETLRKFRAIPAALPRWPGKPGHLWPPQNRPFNPVRT
jgi:hypothetical protein